MMLSETMGDMVYQYRGRDANGARQVGLVISTDSETAECIAGERGILYAKIHIDITGTIKWRYVMKGYDRTAVALLLDLLGQNITSGLDVTGAMKSSMLFIDDGFVRNACHHMLDWIARGIPLSQAMLRAGFDEADCAVIEALSAASSGEALCARAETIKFESDCESDVTNQLRLFIGMFVCIAALAYFILVWVVPSISINIADVIPDENRRPPLLNGMVGFARAVSGSEITATVIYLSFCGGVVWLFGGQYRHEAVRLLFPSYERFNYYLDQYRTWQLWQILTSVHADGGTQRIFAVAERSATHRDVRYQNRQLREGVTRARRVEDVLPVAAATPDIRDRLLSAFTGQSQEATMQMFLQLLAVNIRQYRERTVKRIWLTRTIIIAVALGGCLMALLLPPILLAGNVA